MFLRGRGESKKGYLLHMLQKMVEGMEKLFGVWKNGKITSFIGKITCCKIYHQFSIKYKITAYIQKL